MHLNKILAVLVAVVLVSAFPGVSAAGEDTQLQIDPDDLARIYVTTWEKLLPLHSTECMRLAIKNTGQPITCNVLQESRFQFSFQDFTFVSKKYWEPYSVQQGDKGVKIREIKGGPIHTELSELPLLIEVCFFLFISIESIGRHKAYLWTLCGGVFAAAVLGGIVGMKTDLIGGLLMGLLTGGFASVAAITLAPSRIPPRRGRLVYGFFSLSAASVTMWAGAVAGMITGTSGWIEGGMNEYLLFLALLSAAGLALRWVISQYLARREIPNAPS